MRSHLVVLAFVVPALTAQAQLTTTYAGTVLVGDQQVPATAQFSVETGRVAAIFTGGHGGRLVYDAKTQVLHIISDGEKVYFDVTKAGAASGDPTGMMGAMEQQLAKMPKEQRAMAEQMMKGAMGGSTAAAPPLTYVWTKDKATVAGYDCTRVEGRRGNDKITEYCGSTSPDFRMTDAERQTMLDMQGYLRNFGIGVRSGDETRAFQWDTSADGYPVITRCFRDGKMTLDLALTGVNRNPLSDELFALPSGYKKMDMATQAGARH